MKFLIKFLIVIVVIGGLIFGLYQAGEGQVNVPILKNVSVFDGQDNQRRQNQPSQDETSQQDPGDESSPDVEPGKRAYDDWAAVGYNNKAYLTSNGFESIVIEADILSDQYSSVALGELQANVDEYSQKDVILNVSESDKESGGSYSYTELINLIEENKDTASTGENGVIYVLYLDGEYAENPDALGLAITSGSMVIFPEKIREATTALINAEQIEEAVLIHEFGHLLGLININYQSEYDHEDPDYPNHSNNDQSVMYWAVEDISVSNVLNGGPPTEFDQYDKADIEMIAER